MEMTEKFFFYCQVLRKIKLDVRACIECFDFSIIKSVIKVCIDFEKLRDCEIAMILNGER